MSDNMHPAKQLAGTPGFSRDSDWHDAADDQLRRIPALEAERDERARAAEGQMRLNVTLVLENAELIAEREKLCTEVEALRADAVKAKWEQDNVRDAANMKAHAARVAKQNAERIDAINTKCADSRSRQAKVFPATVEGVVSYLGAGQYGIKVAKNLRRSGECAVFGLTAADKGRTVSVRVEEFSEELL